VTERLTRSFYPSKETSSFYETSTAAYKQATTGDTSNGLRVGAFNVRVFGQKKVADANVLNILVQVTHEFLANIFIIDVQVTYSVRLLQ